MVEIWIWQQIISPHMAGLAAALSARGCAVTYVAEEKMSPERSDQGWAVPELPGVRLAFARLPSEVDELVDSCQADAVHLCQGIRANRMVGQAQIALARRGSRQWVVMETVDDTNWLGILKRLEYRRLFYCWDRRLEGVLAIGYRTSAWVSTKSGREFVFPFAYFLAESKSVVSLKSPRQNCFRLLFVGQLIERKRLDLLIDALGQLMGSLFELCVVGTGRLEATLRAKADRVLPGRVNWIGSIQSDQIPNVMKSADCLVLPSRHDGWGAVVSESLLVGTPVICSDACGSAEVVSLSGAGGVFASGQVESLRFALDREIQTGFHSCTKRAALAQWASCLGARVGADYLINILDYAQGIGSKPMAPWAKSSLLPLLVGSGNLG